MLGFPFQKAWRLTVRQLTSLFDNYCIWHGLTKKEEVDDEQ
nr:MAG TPA: hypothetical protein [Caudoviricetes sp.]